MLEGVVATILNRYLGKYIQDLDTENLNVGIFSGNVQLVDLKLKPEALYELDLPIEVKVGTVGRISLNIPWSGLYTQSVIINVEDVYVIAGPVVDRKYDADKEKRLMRATKKRKLESLEGDSLVGTGPPDSKTFFEHLVTTIINNLQVFIRNIHIRYEDSVTNPDCPFACGVCIQTISAETTNSKWKPSITAQGASSVYQLVRMDSFSIYWNPSCGASGLIANPVELGLAPYNWRCEMKKGLETFSVNKEDFEFIVKPITCKVKVIVNRSNEVRVPKLLVDFVLQDAATQLSRQQYLGIIELSRSMRRMTINRQFRQFHPEAPVTNNAPKWWKYAYNSVLEQRVRPRSWQYMKKHREYYHNYKNIYKKTLLSPNDTELKLDMQQLEDQLGIIDIVIAREHAKIQLRHEAEDHVVIQKNSRQWWEVWNEEKAVEIHVQTDKGKGLWALLSSPEKKKLFETIGFVEGLPRPEKPKQYIEHKFNVTVANCSVSLVSHQHEVLVITLTQFLTSLETRPSAQAFKMSTRAESFVVEGTNLEYDLIPIVTADNVLTGNTSSNFLALDFEKNPTNVDADFALAFSLESMEVVYHEHAISEIITFFQTRSVSLEDVVEWSKQHLMKAADVARGLVEYTIVRNTTTHFTMDLKGPYFVIPELGSVQKGGSVMVVDLGRVVVSSDIQPSNAVLEDATQMELEERLYDRLHLDCSDLQLIFCDSGEEWREVRKQQDSDHHLVPKIRCQVVFSNSIKPDYRQMPKHKLNVSLSSLKLNLSDRKIGMVLDFLDNLPLPSTNTVRVCDAEILSEHLPNLAADLIIPELTKKHLMQVKQSLVIVELERDNRTTSNFNKTGAKMAMLEVEKSFISSDHSDEENELWARTVDLPGFDDNVSPRNTITMLLRFNVGEVVIQLARSNNLVDKPYLMLRVTKLCCDTALMEYGPAIQASIGGVKLIDKIHTGCSGEYLELVSTDHEDDMVTLLYRKVQADCPDFKSHFFSVEQSLVLDFSSVNVVFHREAFCTLNKYLQYLLQKYVRISSRDMVLKILPSMPTTALLWLLSGEKDPPIPPGATKFSYSTRLGEIKLKLCDTELEFLEIRVTGMESDCLFKANERMVLRIYLTTISVDDLSDMTLYPKILAIEEDKVFEFKYVRHSPRLYSQSNLGPSNKDDVKSDGSLRLHIGRLHIVLLYKLLVDLQIFLEPFIPPGLVPHYFHLAERTVEQHISQLRGWSTKLHLSLGLHFPTFLLPQKTASPNLIIVNMGEKLPLQ
uniref:Chorein N-terminal domain-containing protein n=1 Tax=Timema shepardi TaxID=629360 RepID=A0A7R9FXP9_TIMSH|nr:unnamed protein product [Timema shepardi]